MASPSVGAVKHSGVFSCDWDSLDEENVRHGAWLSARWSSSRGLRENGKQAELPSFLRLCHPFFSSLPPLPCCCLLHPSLFPLLASLNGGSSLVIHGSPLSVPRQPPSTASLSATTHNYSIKAPRGLAAWLMLTKEFIVVDLSSQSQLLSLYCVGVLLARHHSCSSPNNLQ